MSITKEEIKKTWDDLVSLKKRIEDEWAQGKRDMMRANILGLADDLIRMMDALSADDVNAFRVASQECREHASSLQMHGTVWLNKSRGLQP